MRRLVDTYGADRVMWGSDYGNTRDSFAKMVELIGAILIQLLISFVRAKHSKKLQMRLA